MDPSGSLGVYLKPVIRQLEETWAKTHCRAIGKEQRLNGGIS